MNYYKLYLLSDPTFKQNSSYELFWFFNYIYFIFLVSFSLFWLFIVIMIIPSQLS